MTGIALAAGGLVFLSLVSGPDPTTRGAWPSTPSVSRDVARYPGGARFEPNLGQADAAVDFVARAGSSVALLSDGGALLAVPACEPGVADPPARAHCPLRLLRLWLPGAATTVEGAGEAPLRGRTSYLVADRRVVGVPHYGQVRYADVHPGIEVVYRGAGGGLEFDFVVAPGADPARIRVAFEGHEALRLKEDGQLRIELGGGGVELRAPSLWQEIDGRRVPVAGGFALLGDTVAFHVGPYDRRHALTIDPLVLVYSTYAGGSGWDRPTAMAVGPDGAVYVAGETYSVDFPVTPGAFQVARPGGRDAFVLKVDTDQAGQGSLVYATYLGSSGDDLVLGIAVDGAGRAFVAGGTTAGDFPTTPDAIKPVWTPNYDETDAFVAALTSDGAGLLYSTFLGGGADDFAEDIALLGPSLVYVLGDTHGGGFPTTPGAYPTAPGSNRVFLSVLDRVAGSFTYSSLFGGSWIDYGRALAVAADGRAYITGIARSTDFPTTASAFMPSAPPDLSSSYGQLGSFMAVVDPAQTGVASLAYSTYLGAGDATDIAVGPDGHAFVTGTTGSPTFPTTAGAFDTTCEDLVIIEPDGYEWNVGCASDAFVMKIDPSASGAASLAYSTRYGGTVGESGNGIAVDDDGNAYVTGGTSSGDVPTRHALPGTTDRPDGEGDAFVARFNADGTGLVFATRLGGVAGASSVDAGQRIALHPSGDVCVTGTTSASDFPVRTPFDHTANGQSDVFLTRLHFDACPREVADAGPFDWDDPLPPVICITWSGGSAGVGRPEACPPVGCEECSPILGVAPDTAAMPPALEKLYDRAGPPLLETARRTPVPGGAWAALGRSIRGMDTGPYFTPGLRDRALEALTAAQRDPGAAVVARALLLESLNALELDWRVGERVGKPFEARGDAAVLEKAARLRLPEGLRAGSLRLRIEPGLPAVPEGYQLGWPLVTVRLETPDRRRPDRPVEVELYAGWIGFRRPGLLRLLERTSDGFRDVTQSVDYATRTITARLRPNYDYVVVQAVSCLSLGLATSAAAQQSGLMIEGHGGIALSTFDISDVADPGPVFGGGIWYSPVDHRWAIGAEVDIGIHSGSDEQLPGLTEPVDVNVYHFMGKVGYTVYTSVDGRFSLMPNAGAGILVFDADDPDADSESYFAINAGAKLYFNVDRRVSIVVSPQVDIAFSGAAEVGTDNSWVWPLTAGLVLRI